MTQRFSTKVQSADTPICHTQVKSRGVCCLLLRSQFPYCQGSPGPQFFPGEPREPPALLVPTDSQQRLRPVDPEQGNRSESRKHMVTSLPRSVQWVPPFPSHVRTRGSPLSSSPGFQLPGARPRSCLSYVRVPVPCKASRPASQELPPGSVPASASLPMTAELCWVASWPKRKKGAFLSECTEQFYQK